MKVKSPQEPILLSDDAFDSFEKMLKKNEKRKHLTDKERELLNLSKSFEGSVKFDL